MRRSSVLLFAAALVVSTWSPVAADTAADPPSLKAALGEKATDGSVSISSHLLMAAALAESGLETTDLAEEVPVVSFAGANVEVELRFEAYTDANVEAARAAGLEVTGSYPDIGWLTGQISPTSIPALGDVPGLATVHPLYGFSTAVGAVANQADVSMRVDQARALTGLDGSGIEIGILSDSFDASDTGSITGSGCGQTISGTPSQSSGDLPASVGLLEDDSGIDEGRGMAELIHDLAPGADLTFHTANNTEAAFAEGIRDLADCGADVIVDDIIYFAEPMFQDGVVAQAADEVALDGIPYFSSAGNQGTFGVDDTYDDIDPGSDDNTFPPVGDDFHDFGGGDAFAQITLDPGEGIQVVLQWNEPFDGTLGNGALSDYDLLVYDTEDVGSLLAASATIQGCASGAGTQSGDPLEIVTYTNPGPGTDDVFVAVDQFCAGAGGGEHLRIATYGTTTSTTDLGFEAGIFTDAQQYGHAVAENARSVAAVFYGEIDDPTYQAPNNETNVEPFSSLGGDIPIYFDAEGDPVPGGPETRFKPEIAAADGTNTTFFGFDDPLDPDTDPNFFGTSAAAPHAAAVAALVLDGDPSLTSAEVYDRLQTSAIDIESTGVDDLSGYGLVDALNAVATCNGIPATMIGTDGDDNIEGTNGDDVIVTFAGNDVVDGKKGDDLICLGVGADEGKGGAGNDTIFGEAGADTLRGQNGADSLDGGTGNDTLFGGAGGDTLAGGSGSDTLEGSDGSDDLRGGAGDDVLNGGEKPDTIVGQAGADTIDGGNGSDTIEGNDGSDDIVGGAGDDVLDGGRKADTIKGQGGADTIDGGPGNDTVEGNDGRDVIRGRSGNDVLDGGRKADTILAGSGADTIDGGPGKDTVEGNDGTDDIRGGAGDDILTGHQKGDTIRGDAGDDTLNGNSGNDTLFGGTGTDTTNGGSGTDTCAGEIKSSCEL